jgi:hypothetical protein
MTSTTVVPRQASGNNRGMHEEGVGTYSAIANSVGFLSIRAAAEPYFVGSTSGFSLAQMVHLMLSSSFATLARQSMDFASPNTSFDHFKFGSNRICRVWPKTLRRTLPISSLLSTFVGSIHNIPSSTGLPFVERISVSTNWNQVDAQIECDCSSFTWSMPWGLVSLNSISGENMMLVLRYASIQWLSYFINS